MNEAISSFVYMEARLLDEWRLEEWLDLFAEDGIYWIPINETKDPADYPSISYDDKGSLSSRVAQLTKYGARASQSPRSETIHFISNLEATESEGGSIKATYSCMITEFRPGYWRQNGMGVQRPLSCRCSLTLERFGTNFKIKQKQIILINRTQPMDALTVII